MSVQMRKENKSKDTEIEVNNEVHTFEVILLGPLPKCWEFIYEIISY
jgi:hypothetical protein